MLVTRLASVISSVTKLGYESAMQRVNPEGSCIAAVRTSVFPPFERELRYLRKTKPPFYQKIPIQFCLRQNIFRSTTLTSQMLFCHMCRKREIMGSSRQSHELHRTLQLCYTEFPTDFWLSESRFGEGNCCKISFINARRRFLKTFAILQDKFSFRDKNLHNLHSRHSVELSEDPNLI